MRKSITASVLAAFLVVGAACSGDTQEAPDGSTPATEVADSVDDTDGDVDPVTSVDEVTETVPAATTPSTLPAGKPIEVAAESVFVDDLSSECAESVSDARDVVSRNESSFALSEADGDLLNAAIQVIYTVDDSGEKACSDDELERFLEKELQPWLTPPGSSS